MSKRELVKKQFDIIDTKKMSYEDWLVARNDGVGGSDLSALMGMNPYFSNLELYYQKLGLTPLGSTHTKATFWGTKLEPVIRQIGQFFDFETEEYINNELSNNQLRTIVEKKAMIRNKDYPHIIANVDGFEFDGVTRRQYFNADRIAEIKTISKQSADMWEGKLPPYYIPQAHTYLIVCEPFLNYQEVSFYVLQDGRDFWAVRIKEVDWMREAVIEQSTKFWELVVKGREILANERNRDKAMKGIYEIEPDPNPSKSVDQFISSLQKEKTELRKIEGTQELWDMAIAEKEARLERDTHEKSREAFAIELKNYMRKNDVDVIDFGADGGRITFRGRLYNNIKQ